MYYLLSFFLLFQVIINIATLEVIKMENKQLKFTKNADFLCIINLYISNFQVIALLKVINAFIKKKVDMHHLKKQYYLIY